MATRNPLNIGAVARAMSNFGFFRLCLVNPFEPSFREAKSAVGAAELMANAQVFATVGEAVADCTLVIGTTAVGKRDSSAAEIFGRRWASHSQAPASAETKQSDVRKRREGRERGEAK